MKLYSPLSKTVEQLVPRGDEVSVYVCGVTPYDTTHLGHAFTYVSFDVLIRALEYQGQRVRYVQNVTDIDDDILRKASEVGDDWKMLGDRWTAHFIRDMTALNVRPPDHFPRATDVIDGIVATVAKLIDAGVAYESGGNVYFHVDDWPRFGELSGIPRDEMLAVANERGNFPDDPHKRDPLDFVLWQARKPEEPAWDSPWGAGRPGWHIECSTMSEEFLGGAVDIHGGGADLKFPHHECEIAQTEAASSVRPFVQFWMHTAMVRHEGEKMSKSLGNLVMVRDLLKTWSPDSLRLYMSSHHYRETWSHSDGELAEAERLAQRLREAVTTAGASGAEINVSSDVERFAEALDNDLDTPAAVSVLGRVADEIVDAESGDVGSAQEALREMAGVLGLRLDRAEPEERVTRGWGRHLERFT